MVLHGYTLLHVVLQRGGALSKLRVLLFLLVVHVHSGASQEHKRGDCDVEHKVSLFVERQVIVTRVRALDRCLGYDRPRSVSGCDCMRPGTSAC